jgi:thiol-disulfide isomerase/thioredoxin
MRILNIIIILSTLGCSPSSGYHSTDDVEDSQELSHSEGIVSDDPPGADDWNTDTSDENTMKESYTDCSNEIEVWIEPDPLRKPCNFQLLDQSGNLVELYDFEGDVIMLDFSTMWCIVCKRVAEHVQELNDTYEGFSIITVLTQNSSGNQPTLDEIQTWADEYGITTSPVLGGSDMMVGTDAQSWNVVAVPTFFFIDKDFYLRILMGGWNEETATNHIENLLAE